MAASAVAGPSRLPAKLNVPAPSTSGDSEVTAAPVDKGLDTGLLKELSRQALIEILNDVCFIKSTATVTTVLKIQIQGAKTLILDPALAGPLGLITEVALLKVCIRRLIVPCRADGESIKPSKRCFG